MTNRSEVLLWPVIVMLFLVSIVLLIVSCVGNQTCKEMSPPIEVDSGGIYIGSTNNVDFKLEHDCEYYKSITRFMETKGRKGSFVSMGLVEPLEDGIKMTTSDSVIYCDCESCKLLSKYLKRFGGQNIGVNVDESSELKPVAN